MISSRENNNFETNKTLEKLELRLYRAEIKGYDDKTVYDVFDLMNMMELEAEKMKKREILKLESIVTDVLSDMKDYASEIDSHNLKIILTICKKYIKNELAKLTMKPSVNSCSTGSLSDKKYKLNNINA